METGKTGELRVECVRKTYTNGAEGLDVRVVRLDLLDDSWDSSNSPRRSSNSSKECTKFLLLFWIVGRISVILISFI
jgi:hypothetical protein